MIDSVKYFINENPGGRMDRTTVLLSREVRLLQQRVEDLEREQAKLKQEVDVLIGLLRTSGILIAEKEEKQV